MSKMLEQLQKENESTFNKLLDCLKRDEPLALVGSGLVIRAGYPSWADLLDQLREKAEQKGSLKKLPWNDSLKNTKDYLFQAEVYRKSLKGENDSERRYRTFLRNTFASNNQVVPQSLRNFVRLPFRHFMTTNYDPTLERAYRLVFPGRDVRVVDWNKDLVERDTFIASLGTRRGHGPRCFVHIHGIHTNPADIVFTDNDYLDQYVRQETVRRLLFAVFAVKPVVFVGFGMEDPELMYLLRTVAASQGQTRGKHFAILSFNAQESDPDKRNPLLIRERLMSKYDVLPLFYPVWRHHGNLDRLILALKAKDPRRLPNFTLAFKGIGRLQRPLKKGVRFHEEARTPTH
jgi:hypothetical protein